MIKRYTCLDKNFNFNNLPNCTFIGTCKNQL